MALKITSALELIEVEHIVLGIYALPGLGKTTIGFTAEDPLLLDFDKGAYRAKNRKDSVKVDSWADVEGMTKEDLAPYKSIVADTAGRALDYLAADIIAGNPKKYGNGGGLSLQGFGVLKHRFTAWLKQMRTFGKDVILIAHMDEKNEGDVVKERLDIQGSSKTEIYKVADAMAKLYIDGKDRMLDFSPREGSLGKNPAQLEIIKVPGWVKEPQFLGKLIQQIKDSINAGSVEQLAHRQEVIEWEERFAKAANADAINAFLAEVQAKYPTGHPSAAEVKMALSRAAGRYGLVFSQKTKQFEEAE